MSDNFISVHAINIPLLISRQIALFSLTVILKIGHFIHLSFQTDTPLLELSVGKENTYNPS